MITSDQEVLLKRYAKGQITWWELKDKGFSHYGHILAGLGSLSLRPPIAPMEGPNVAARESGRSMLREALIMARK